MIRTYIHFGWKRSRKEPRERNQNEAGKKSCKKVFFSQPYFSLLSAAIQTHGETEMESEGKKAFRPIAFSAHACMHACICAIKSAQVEKKQSRYPDSQDRKHKIPE